MPYAILEHTADLRIKVKSDTLAGLFADASRAVMEIINKEAFGQEIKSIQSVALAASDITSLLVDFLNEILTLGHINKEVYTEVKIMDLTDESLQAELKGVRVEKFDEDIKAATYHNVEIIKNESGEWEVSLIFDI